MKLGAEDILEVLEYNKIVEIAAKECYGEPGRLVLGDSKPILKYIKINQLLDEVNEFKNVLMGEKDFPLGSYSDVSQDVSHLRIVDYIPESEQIKSLCNIMSLFQRMKSFFKKTETVLFPTLYTVIDSPVDFSEPLLHVNKVLDEKGEVKSNASKALIRIRATKGAKTKQIDKVFSSIINEYNQRGMLTDNKESYRNGRRVLSVPVEHKRQIRGIIHDESATGKTVFLEPERIIDLNNDLFDLDMDERKEIIKILKDLCNVIRPYSDDIEYAAEKITQIDVIQAKAKLAIRLKAHKPRLRKEPKYNWKQAFHPLLYIKNAPLAKETIPFDLELIGKNRILLLSGPNAGGKSICMKTVGLLQLMLQSGFLVTMDATSEMGIFDHVFTDIGDQQSLEDDLSTYSSRLQNMKKLLKGATERSLVLIDEFGSGTDPKLGGAIAEAILRELNFRKTYAFITTHYSNLKIFAFKTKGIVNGAMLFDKDTLSPSYIMKIGRPGSSFAYEIATKVGLDDKILKYAKFKTGKNAKAIEDLLIELQSDKKRLEDQLQEMRDREERLQKMIKNYEMMSNDLNVKRKRLKLDTKQLALQKAQRDTQEIDKLIKELKKEKKNIEEIKEVREKKVTVNKDLSKEVKSLQKEVYSVNTKGGGNIKVGDFVRLISGGSAGKVDSISKGRAIVMMGIMKMTVDIEELIPANEPIAIRSNKSINTDQVASSAKFETKIDIRGLRREEAIQTLEAFLDKAIVNNVDICEIIHGKGNGVLKKSVLKKIREYRDVKEYFHPPQEAGGDGVTIVNF